jgi:hypothetical protein
MSLIDTHPEHVNPSAHALVPYPPDGNPPPSRGIGVPSSIPRQQVYYWLSTWQRDERETMDGLEAGDYEDFDSDDPEDAARWLREPDEDG